MEERMTGGFKRKSCKFWPQKQLLLYNLLYYKYYIIISNIPYIQLTNTNTVQVILIEINGLGQKGAKSADCMKSEDS